MHKLSLTCFGVGDGWPCADRNHASFLYRFGKTSILVDCGEPVDGNFKATGLSYDRIDGILLSHLHADHVGGFFMLMQGAWLEGRRKALPVLLPGGAIRPLKGMLNAMFLFDGLIPFRRQFRALRNGRPVRIGEVRITPFAGTHLKGLKARFGPRRGVDFASYSFLFETTGLRVGHSADIGSPQDLAPLLAKPLDLLICELAHFKPEDMFTYLAGRDIRQIVFVHLAREQWRKLGKLRQTARRMLPGRRVTFAKDGEVLGI